MATVFAAHGLPDRTPAGPSSGSYAVIPTGSLIHPLPVTGGIVVPVAAVGVAVNVAATWVLARANRDSINVKGAFAHIITDLYGFIALWWRGS
jgi:cobalt-zinc-cadmium efflux system protein